MTGTTARIYPFQQIDTGANNVPAGTTLILWTLRKIDVSRFTQAILVARLHTVVSALPAGGTLVFQVAPDGYTDDDPAQIWTAPGALPLVTFTGGTDGSLTVRSGSVGTVLGHVPPLIQLRLIATTQVGAAGRFQVNLSADLNVKGE